LAVSWDSCDIQISQGRFGEVREKLEERGVGYRGAFTAEISRWSRTKSGKYKQLLVNVCEDGELVCDHLWIAEMFERLVRVGVVEGDEIEFDATVQRYWKGFAVEGRERERDYELVNFSKVRLHKSKKNIA
jgi:hypothetical protein